MLGALIRWSIHNRAVVLFLAALLLGGGAYAARNARFDVFPEFAPPQVVSSLDVSSEAHREGPHE